MSTNPLYNAWFCWLSQHLPGERITRVRTAATMAMGLFLSSSVHLSKIAAWVGGHARLLSRERQFSRFVDNAAVKVKRWYEPIARQWLKWCADTYGEVVLIVDGTRVSTHHQLLMVAVAMPKGRALPVAWTWMNTGKGHSDRKKQLALLDRVRRLIPPTAQVTVVGDSEFGAVDVMRHVSQEWHWKYVLRQKSNNQVRTSADGEWRNFDELVIQPGNMCFVPNGLLTLQHAFPTALLAVWEKGQKECWLLATNCTSADEAIRSYRQRMLIEEMFADFKGHGFDLEQSRLQTIPHLNRLVLLVCLLYVWLIREGLALINSQRTSLVDRADRRDLSLFQLGVRYMQRLVVNLMEIRVSLSPDSLQACLRCDQIKLSGS
jgi:hypothetical protein